MPLNIDPLQYLLRGLPKVFSIFTVIDYDTLTTDFLLTNPRNGMRAGGIWSPLLGTIYLVVISLVISTPIGVLAAVSCEMKRATTLP